MKTSSVILFVVLSIILSSCRNTPVTETSGVITRDSFDRVNEPPPPPPGRLTKGKYLTQDSLMKYLVEAKAEIRKPGKGKPFNSLHYNKVIAYEFEGREERNSHIFNSQGRFAPVITKQRALEQAKVDWLTNLLSKKSTYGGVTAACFVPHTALAFYRDTIPVMDISICLGCNYLESSIKIPAESENTFLIDTASYPAYGFSDDAKKELRKFCDNLGYVYAK
ncbi:MAG: hypothetical protein JWO03_1388 [Bacteroidetes bacterium]|nr:hypothetical protein [Bacteroidota bacterium]